MSRGECFCSGHTVSLAAAQVRENVGVHRRVGRWCPPHPGAGSLYPGTGPQFLTLPPQCDPVEAEEEEPGEQAGGEDLGEGLWRVPLSSCLSSRNFWGQSGLMPSSWPDPCQDSSPPPTICLQSFPKGVGAAGCLGSADRHPRHLGSLRWDPFLTSLSPSALSCCIPLPLSIPWEPMTLFPYSSASAPTGEATSGYRGAGHRGAGHRGPCHAGGAVESVRPCSTSSDTRDILKGCPHMSLLPGLCRVLRASVCTTSPVLSYEVTCSHSKPVESRI